jgi:MFS family permease
VCTLLIIDSNGNFSNIAFLKILIGISAVMVGPAIVSITLGISGHKNFPTLAGQTSAYNHSGNVTAALLAGIIGHIFGLKSVFIIVVFSTLISLFFLFKIKRSDIDYKLSRGFTKESIDSDKLPIVSLLKKCPLLLVLAISLLLFHLANGAMLPLLGEKLSENNQNLSSILMSACIIVAQLSMIPMALLVSKKVDMWGPQTILTYCFCYPYNTRCFIYTTYQPYFTN